jgi:glutamine amidotransferase
MKVSIIDYDIGNLLSVTRAFETVGAEVEVIQDPARVSGAERLVVPGVGAFAAGGVVVDGVADWVVDPGDEFGGTGGGEVAGVPGRDGRGASRP